MAAAYVFIQRRRRLRRERVLRDYNNPLDYLDDESIVSKYRLTRPMIHNLCAMFERDLHRPTMRSRSLPVSLQIMVALLFYASGSFQEVVADIHNISRQSTGNAIEDVTNCLIEISKHNIKMPVDVVELNKIKKDFYEIAHFPNTVGAIDCTHIRMKAPTTDEHLLYV
ncbi:putative nuclease HARBI1 [Saccostrea cucullata]|uniref:putative nuclease HARBI1 n=1 Tax=Saccostrea cuccullata TaxID=36930 RepID=UPI002ED641A1